MPRETHEAPSGPKPLGPYRMVTEANGLVFISGMVAIDPTTGEAVRGGAAPQAEQIMRNIGAVEMPSQLFNSTVTARIEAAIIGRARPFSRHSSQS